jgi:phospholipid/cholesterol/gamma-HCH transport system ATP-binding protein
MRFYERAVAIYMIDIRGVTKSFDGITYLKGVDLRVRDGETIALMGSSGSGKSLLLKIITGLVVPDAGQVIVEGKDITNASRRDVEFIRESIGMIFQGNALFDSMTVEENIGFALKRMHGFNPLDIPKRVREAMDQVRLGAIEELYPSQLSGGMKKRVAIARAIVSRPRILLADEPTAGLDPATSRAIVKLLGEIRSSFKTTCLLVTSSLETAGFLAEKVAFLNNGHIEAITTPADMKNSVHEILRRFALTPAPGSETNKVGKEN